MGENQHVGGSASALVLLAAIATTFITYEAYKDDKLATLYEEDQVAMEYTASALVALRLEEQALLAAEESATSTTLEIEED